MHGTDTPSDDKPAKMARLQHWLLRSAVSACRPGGTIIYCTCTTSVEENEEVIEWILKKDAGKIELEPIVWSQEIIDAGIITPGLDPGKLTARVKKEGDMEGFFVAQLRRLSRA
jgi:16S rRNA C967 or C1407 C5-methylase (RsmB/RsmF family)